MVSNDVRTAFDDMEEWLDLAETAEKSGEYSNRIVISLYIKAVIRGNDFLCLHYLDRKPGRHGESAEFYAELCEDNHIDEKKYSKYKSNIATLLRQKADYEYKSKHLSKSDFKKLKKQSKRFIDNAVGDHAEQILG